MSNPVAQRTVATVLEDPAIQRINFVIGGFEIRPPLYQLVHDAITSVIGRRVEVLCNPNQRNDAWYDSDHNQFSLKSVFARPTTKQALIVHEATHAGCDLRNDHHMRVDTSEAAAYIAQCIYMRQKTRPADLRAGTRLIDDDPDIDAIFEQAWTVAGSILDHGFSHRADTEELQRRIRACETYNPQHLQTMAAAGFNG